MESEYVDMEPGWSKKNVWNELKSQYQHKAVNLGKAIFNARLSKQLENLFRLHKSKKEVIFSFCP